MSDPIPWPVGLPPIPTWPLFLGGPLGELECPDECEIRFWPAACVFALWHPPSELHVAVSQDRIEIWPQMAQFMRGAVFGWRVGLVAPPYRLARPPEGRVSEERG